MGNRVQVLDCGSGTPAYLIFLFLEIYILEKWPLNI